MSEKVLTGAEIVVSVNGFSITIQQIDQPRSIEEIAEEFAKKVKKVVTEELKTILKERESTPKITLAKPIDRILEDTST